MTTAQKLYKQIYKLNEKNLAALEQINDTIVEMNREYKKLGNF